MYKVGTAKEAKSLINKIPRRVCIEAYNLAKIIDRIYVTDEVIEENTATT